jgi:nitrate reductase gamma subunit
VTPFELGSGPEALLAFARGPLFYAALLVFVAGMGYRLVRILLLPWGSDLVPAKRSKLGGVVRSFLKGILIWPFIPWVKGTFGRRPVVYIAGGILHLGLIAVVIFGTAHMLVWKDLLGFGWYTLPLPIVDWVAAITLVALLVLALNRVANPVSRQLTRASDWFNLLFVFLPFLTGYFLAHHLALRYEAMFAIHVLTVDVLLVWIPLSRISHFMFYFISRAIHGAEFAKRGARA